MIISRRAEFWAGVRQTIPLVVGALPFGLIFGAFASLNGLSPAGVLGFSLFVFAGSAQFIAATLVGEHASLLLIVLTTAVVNIRHALYSATLLPYTRQLPQRWLLPLSFWLTDETFIVTHQHYVQNSAQHPYQHWFQFGSSLALYLAWNTVTLLGIVAGQTFQGITALGLNFAMTVTFIGMLLPQIRKRPVALAVVVAGVSAALLYPILEHKLWLIVATLLGMIAGVLAENAEG